ncbi:Protein CBG27226 [Caenorhabditis briggsae]|uniref:Protein CBG27226 n=1 Tax=Caenorhabditis briggsae TaxID=6238 RepID=B6IFU9_CAEBR|nr:Protein CBG27226 [Caenorhabditis briggsae]CAR98765.1 Protein CBG27226 [Caenorhabditis briggsae]
MSQNLAAKKPDRPEAFNEPNSLESCREEVATPRSQQEAYPVPPGSCKEAATTRATQESGPPATRNLQQTGHQPRNPQPLGVKLEGNGGRKGTVSINEVDDNDVPGENCSPLYSI